MLAPDGVWYAVMQSGTCILPDGRYARKIEFVDNCDYYMLEYLNDGFQEWKKIGEEEE
jgi:hypothetical protein